MNVHDAVTPKLLRAYYEALRNWKRLVCKSPAEAGPCGLLVNFYFAYVYSFGITSIKSGEQSLNDYLIDATAYA